MAGVLPPQCTAGSRSPCRIRTPRGTSARRDKLLRILVDQFFMHEHPAGGDAALAARFEGADDAARHRQVELGIIADDDRALRAHLAGDDAIKVLRRELLNAMPDVVAAGEE